MKTKIAAYFNDFNAGAKDVIKLEIRGELTDEQIVKLHKLKRNDVIVTLESGQMDLEDYEDDHEGMQYEGMQYTVNQDGTVDVEQGQMTLEEAAAAAEQAQEQEQAEEQEQEQDGQGETSDKVTDIAQERKRRGRPRKQDKEEKQEEQLAAAPDDELPPLAGDDDLPF